MFPWVTILFVLAAALACLRRGARGVWIIGCLGLGFLYLTHLGFGSTEWFLVTLTVGASAVIAFVGPPAGAPAPRVTLPPLGTRPTGSRAARARSQRRDADRWPAPDPVSMGPPLAWRELFDPPGHAAQEGSDGPGDVLVRKSSHPPDDPTHGAPSERSDELSPASPPRHPDALSPPRGTEVPRGSMNMAIHGLSPHQARILGEVFGNTKERTALLADPWEDLLDRPGGLPPHWTEHPARGEARAVPTGSWGPESPAGVEVRFEGIAPGDASVLAVFCDWNEERRGRKPPDSGHDSPMDARPVVALVPTELPSVKRLSPRSSERARWVSQCTFLPGRNIVHREQP